MIGNIIGSLFSKVVDNAEGILDKVITTDKERDEAKLALKKLLLDAEREAFAKEVEDRKSARDMYKDDAIIQKVLATLFTVAYFGITFDGTPNPASQLLSTELPNCLAISFKRMSIVS